MTTTAAPAKFTEGDKGASFAKAFEKIMAKSAKHQAKAAASVAAAAEVEGVATAAAAPPSILSVRD